ncbi:hypothetical protein I3842_08G125600 [Carya illinoinensis]|uniref:Uncharacterized protein n=1 Tax=Carya illinoinensis TaxID=32201 RepID=A0A922EF41_CARIL|nr:hypothetical protein I3842_08G125600 [Carya illinoinensis]
MLVECMISINSIQFSCYYRPIGCPLLSLKSMEYLLCVIMVDKSKNLVFKSLEGSHAPSYFLLISISRIIFFSHSLIVLGVTYQKKKKLFLEFITSYWRYDSLIQL